MLKLDGCQYHCIEDLINDLVACRTSVLTRCKQGHACPHGLVWSDPQGTTNPYSFKRMENTINGTAVCRSTEVTTESPPSTQPGHCIDADERHTPLVGSAAPDRATLDPSAPEIPMGEAAYTLARWLPLAVSQAHIDDLARWKPALVKDQGKLYLFLYLTLGREADRRDSVTLQNRALQSIQGHIPWEDEGQDFLNDFQILLGKSSMKTYRFRTYEDEDMASIAELDLPVNIRRSIETERQRHPRASFVNIVHRNPDGSFAEHTAEMDSDIKRALQEDAERLSTIHPNGRGGLLLAALGKCDEVEFQSRILSRSEEPNVERTATADGLASRSASRLGLRHVARPLYICRAESAVPRPYGWDFATTPPAGSRLYQLREVNYVGLRAVLRWYDLRPSKPQAHDSMTELLRDLGLDRVLEACPVCEPVLRDWIDDAGFLKILSGASRTETMWNVDGEQDLSQPFAHLRAGERFVNHPAIRTLFVMRDKFIRETQRDGFATAFRHKIALPEYDGDADHVLPPRSDAKAVLKYLVSEVQARALKLLCEVVRAYGGGLSSVVLGNSDKVAIWEAPPGDHKGLVDFDRLETEFRMLALDRHIPVRLQRIRTDVDI